MRSIRRIRQNPPNTSCTLNEVQISKLISLRCSNIRLPPLYTYKTTITVAIVLGSSPQLDINTKPPATNTTILQDSYGTENIVLSLYSKSPPFTINLPFPFDVML